MSDEEEERHPSDFTVFIDNVDQYIGSAVSKFLVKQGYTVYGYGSSSPDSRINMVSSRKEGILSAELSVFEMLEDTSAVAEALEIVNTCPLHKKIRLAIFSTLLTWGGRSLKNSEEEEEEKHEDEQQAESGEDAEPKEEEDFEEPEPFTPINEEDYLQRIPHDLVREQYKLECRALQLNDENDRLKVFIFGIGLLYGLGENTLFPFFRALWENKIDTFPATLAHITCLHVSNLGLAIRQLLESPPEEEEERRYYILGEEQSPTLKSIGIAFSKVLSDGKTSEFAEQQIPELHKAILTTELASESSFLADVAEDMHLPDGIISSAAKIVDEFREKYHLEPLKVNVVGPPASGYDDVAKRIAAHIGAPFIDPIALVDEVKKETSTFGDEIREMISENEDQISNEIICKVAHRRMAQRDCRNYGWVISGFSENVENAGSLFDIGEEETPSPHFEHIPTHLIVLEAKDDELERKAAETSDDMEQFQKKLRAYRRANDGDTPIFTFFDDHAIPSIICDAFEDIDEIIFDFLGPKRDFGRPLEEIEAEKAEAERIVREKEEAEKKVQEEQLSQQTSEWNQGDGVHDAAMDRLQKRDEEFLAEKAKDLEQYLHEAVFDSIVEGLIHIGETMPEDPVDELAAFLFAKHREKKAVH